MIDPAAEHAPLILDEGDRDQCRQLAALKADPAVTTLDRSELLLGEFAAIIPAQDLNEAVTNMRWVYYPWRATLVKMLGPAEFNRLRLDRNRFKIKHFEQLELQERTIGVVGLSTGHVIATTLALEGLCKSLRLADHDALDLSNLNRLPATIFDIGLNKAVFAARRVAEIDPYLHVEIFPDGVTDDNVAEFVEGLDLIVEQCDSFDMKVAVRAAARRGRVPVLMETNDRGLFDVERYDLEPDRPLFHGLLAGVDAAALRDLTMEQKTRYLLRVLDPGRLSPGGAASLLEIGRTIANWPQLASETQLGSATVAAAVRRIGTGQELPSGRIRIDLDRHLAELGKADDTPPTPTVSDEVENLLDGIPTEAMAAVVHAARLAPSGGNSQPWTISADPDRVRIRLSTLRTTTMDIDHRGSLVAVGAAAFNARVAAARHGVLGGVRTIRRAGETALQVDLAPGTERALAQLYPAMLNRMANRSAGHRRALTGDAVERLEAAASAEGGALRLVTGDAELVRLSEILADADRVRYLTPTLHEEMFKELSWPGRDRLDLGIDVRTLGLAPSDLPLLEVIRQWNVMERLTPEPDLGSALGDITRDRVASASAIGVVTVLGSCPEDYLRGGAAVERTWIEAGVQGLGVYPISPVFLYASTDRHLSMLSKDHAKDLALLQREMEETVGLESGESPVLILRLSHDPEEIPRSGRLPLSQIMVSFEDED